MSGLAAKPIIDMLAVAEETSTRWRGWLAFRDYLRAHPRELEEYAALKRRLASD